LHERQISDANTLVDGIETSSAVSRSIKQDIIPPNAVEAGAINAQDTNRGNEVPAAATPVDDRPGQEGRDVKLKRRENRRDE
jgi:hypothetical protein